MGQDQQLKKRPRWMVVVPTTVAASLVFAFIGAFLWSGHFFYSGPMLCQKSGIPFVWFFNQDEKGNKLKALWAKEQTCALHSHGGSEGWEPFGLKYYKVQGGSLCRNVGEQMLYSFKQGSSALGGSYRLDIVENEPFFQSTDPKLFSDPKGYCDPGYLGWCEVKLVPVCRHIPPRTEIPSAETLSTCASPQDKIPLQDGNYGASSELAAVMIHDQRGNEGFSYTLSEHAASLKNGVALAQGPRGEVSCYYFQDQGIRHVGIELIGEHPQRIIATRDQAVQGCMAVLTDRNHYCPSKAMPHYSEF